MKTLMIKLTDEQQRDIRKLLDISESEPCEYLGIKLKVEEVKSIRILGPEVVMYIPAPDQPFKTTVSIV